MLKKVKIFTLKFLQKSVYINYIFFSLFFLVIISLATFQTNFLFGLYSFLQTILIIGILIFLLDKIKYTFFKKLFIILSFFILIAYVVNFILVGLINQGLIFALNIFFSGGFKNLFVTFRAINLSFAMYLVIFLGIILLPTTGLFIYFVTNKICLKKPLFLKKKHLFSAFFTALLTLFLIDFGCKYKNINSVFKNQKRLPFGFSFLSNKKTQINLPYSLKPIRDEKKLLKKINKKNLYIENKPNIFIFITEALRKDYITEEIAPNLYHFSQDNTTFNTSFSASCASMISWYSIFHSNHPIYWSKAQETQKFGSLPLKILKNAGYKINVLSSAELQFFNLDKLIFGKDLSLIDNFNDFSHISSNPAIRDNMTIETLINEICSLDKQNSNVFIVFLDSTHSEYSWLDDFKPKFLPYATSINYLTLSHFKNNLDLLKNRYKNAISYIDHLFNKFLETLKNNNLYENSLIVFTADHAEEFFEEGSLFHASHLNDYQLQIPIIYKLIKSDKKISETTTHIDIFPTILSQILPNESFDDLFDGKSIFNENKSSYIISANQRGSFTPNELLITKNQTKIIGKINNSKKSLNFEIENFQNIEEENLETEVTNAFEDLVR